MAYVRRYDWFAGKLVGKREDRLGTVETGSRFYPYGDESPATGQDEQKFATYWRDSNTGLDYAMARYHSSGTGRFLTPDPYRGSASVARSGSWNRYTYVEGDPVNKNDPSWLRAYYPGRWFCDDSDHQPQTNTVQPVEEASQIGHPGQSFLTVEAIHDAEDTEPGTNRGQTAAKLIHAMESHGRNAAEVDDIDKSDIRIGAPPVWGILVQHSLVRAIFYNKILLFMND